MAGVPRVQKPSNLILEEPSPPEDDESPAQFVASPNRHRVECHRTIHISSSFTAHPLDYPALVTQEILYEKELNHTLKELVHWLANVEAGFISILDNAIEEEQEIPLDDLNNAQLYLPAKHDAVL